MKTCEFDALGLPIRLLREPAQLTIESYLSLLLNTLIFNPCSNKAPIFTKKHINFYISSRL